jgi:hypothetical protein
MRGYLLIISLLVASASYSQDTIWLIGTAHERTSYINPDSLTAAFAKIKPELILLELEAKHFTEEYDFDVSKYALKDYLTINENIASYAYKQKYGIQLRPFDIVGRHEFYEKENYRGQENTLFKEMMSLYKSNQLSQDCNVDFEVLLAALGSYSTLSFRSLQEANSDVATKFLALKNKVNFELMLSIVKRTKQLEKWVGFAQLRKDYWDERNTVMAENILRYSREFSGKRVVVLVGNDHKYALVDLLRQHKLVVKNYYE